MLQSRGKSNQPPLQTIQVTGHELILINTSLHYYLDFLRSSNPALYQQAAPIIQNFISRLHGQLPPRRDQEGPHA
jgi:hypothetical protein